ncbi:unnamed protein product, partial [Staurois parvus]
MLKRTVCRCHQLSAESTAKDLQTSFSVKLLRHQHTKKFWTISQLCGNSLGIAPSCSNMTAHQ